MRRAPHAQAVSILSIFAIQYMKNHFVKTGLITGAGVLIISCFLTSRRIDAPGTTGTPGGPAFVIGQDAKQVPPHLSYTWVKGAAVSYDFKMETGLDQDSSTQPVQEAAGRYHVVVLDDGRRDGTVDLATAFSDLKYLSGGKSCSYFGKMLEQVPCLIRMNQAGRILGWDFPSWLQAGDRQVIVGMNLAQMELGQPDPSGRWVNEELDANGIAETDYQFVSHGLILKHRNRYKNLNVQGLGSDSALRITNSSFTGKVGKVWLDSYEGSESMTFDMAGNSAWVSHCQVSLKAEPEAAHPEILRTLAGCQGAAEALAMLTGDLPEIIQLAGSGSVTDLENAAARKAHYATTGFASIMASFDETFLKARSHAERMPAIEALRDWLLARPEEAGKLAAYLADPALPEESSSGVLHALELSSASPASQTVLADVLGDPDGKRYSSAVLIQAAVAAGGVGEITEQRLMDQLYKLAFAISNPDTAQASDSSLMALGTLSRTNPAIRERLASELGETLRETTPGTEGYVISALMALANGAVRDKALNASASQLFQQSPSDAVRAEALAYLHATGDTAPASGALTDKSTAVQLRAVELLTAPAEILEITVSHLTDTLRNPAADESVRTTAAQLLQRHASTHAGIVQAYGEVLTQNPPQNLRGVLEAVMAAPHNP